MTHHSRAAQARSVAGRAEAGALGEQEYIVKFRGAAVLDEAVMLRALGAVPNAPFIVLPARPNRAVSTAAFTRAVTIFAVGFLALDAVLFAIVQPFCLGRRLRWCGAPRGRGVARYRRAMRTWPPPVKR